MLKTSGIRVMNELIARHVMQWRLSLTMHTKGPWWMGYQGIGNMYESDWQPVLNKEHLFMAVDRMNDLGWSVQFTCTVFPDGKKSAAAACIKYDNNAWPIKSTKVHTGESIGVVVCAAMLDALGVTYNEDNGTSGIHNDS